MVFKSFEEKKEYLDNLYYNVGNQKSDFELCFMDKKKDINSKWRKWSKIGFDIENEENKKWVILGNNRTILKNEVVLDLEDPERFEEILEKLKFQDLSFKAFKTGSKGYHFHLFFRDEVSSEDKLKIIECYGCDTQKSSERCMIALEFENHWKTGNSKELIEKGGEGLNYVKEILSKNNYGEKNKINELGIVKGEEEKLDNSVRIFTRGGQIEEFYKQNQFFYNKSKMFFCWNDEFKKYELSDEVDMLNGIANILGLDTINSKVKTELIAGFQQIGRKHIPKDAPSSWVQFKEKIIDFKNGKEFEASPEYFITNPIPWKLGETEDTPTIDGLFIEWVGENYEKTLEQICAYCISPEQFMQRLIALIGGGSNGKGTFVKFIKKLLGKDNIVSSELKELSNNQFETSAIYKKLVCVMGEVSYDDLKNTNQIKKLAGEDDIRFCFKGKTPFSEKSPTTCICQTNSLPRTPDKTIGFYRKWLIVDFPNQFSDIKHGLIENISDEEFQNFCKKILRILKELYKTQKFENEGTFEERINKYEERSNPVLKFIEKDCLETIEEKIELKIFTNIFNEYAKKNHLRVMNVRQVSKVLKEEGFEQGNRSIDTQNGNKTSKQYILNLTLKNTKNTGILSRFPCVESTSISGISGISKQEKLSFTQEELKKAGYDETEIKEIQKFETQTGKDNLDKNLTAIKHLNAFEKNTKLNPKNT